LSRHTEIFLQQSQCFLGQRPGFGCFRFVQRRLHIGRQTGIGFYAERFDGIPDGIDTQLPYLAHTRATPLSRAAWATAAATASGTRGSNALGRMFSSLSSSSGIRPAMALAAAIFMAGLMSRARTDKAP